MHEKAQTEWWRGRMVQSTKTNAERWQQKVLCRDFGDCLDEEGQYKVGLIGYCSDLGTVRNHGRPGSKEGPQVIRKTLANFADHIYKETTVLDLGNLHPERGNLEELQMELANSIEKMLRQQIFPVVLGGSHDLAYGHFMGTSTHLQRQDKHWRLGIINFDAHLDLRPFAGQATSGTPFTQIAILCQDEGKEFFYLCIGIEEVSNTKDLFRRAEKCSVPYFKALDINTGKTTDLEDKIHSFLGQIDHFILSIDLDCFPPIHSPGVSAPAKIGLNFQIAWDILRDLFKHKKLTGYHIAEFNPVYDLDDRTARLAAMLVEAGIRGFESRSFNQ